jgi:hypothetical protein
LTAEEADALARVDRAARWLDARFRLPGTDLRVGLDGLIGLIPGIGDAATALAGLWMLGEARRLGAPAPILLRMAGNLGLDALIGAVPLLGDLLDFGFKAHARNAALLRDHLETRPP